MVASTSTGLYIPDKLFKRIAQIARDEDRSWNQTAKRLLERGLEAQPSEVADLVAAAKKALACSKNGNTLEVQFHLSRALAPFKGES